MSEPSPEQPSADVNVPSQEGAGPELRQPVQPLETDADGTVRFKRNAIVRFLLDAGPFDMNQLALMPFSDEDREQFAQLIGYSLTGFGELSYVSDETYERAAMDFGFDEGRPTLTVRYPNELVVERGYEGMAMIDSPHEIRHFEL